MTRRRLLAGLVLAVSSLGIARDASAQILPPAPAAELCRALDEDGELERLGLTRGECVNILAGPASPEAANRIAGSCGRDRFQQALRVENKGQCIQVLRG